MSTTVEQDELQVDELRRRVAWQVSVAYGLSADGVAVVQDLEEEPFSLPVTVLPAALPEPEPELEPEPEPAVEVEPPPAAATRLELPTLHELEGLVSAAGDTVPAHRLEEWRWYLFYLRDFASTDGTLPDSFALLVETVFGPLL